MSHILYFCRGLLLLSNLTHCLNRTVLSGVLSAPSTETESAMNVLSVLCGTQSISESYSHTYHHGALFLAAP